MPDEITSHLRPQLLGRMTQRAVVETLLAKGPLTRADIARLTGISPTTVSSAVTQVLKAGLVEETDAAISGPGRPGKILRLNAATAQVIGVSVEPEWCEVRAGGLDGRPHPDRHARFPTPNTYARLLAEIDRHVRRWLGPPDTATQTLGLGVTLPGLLDPAGEEAMFSPNLHQMDGQRPGRDLRDRLGLPTVLVQESDALCLAERRVHAADDLAVIDYTGGLGLGVLTGGRLLGRHLGLPRELGHVTAVPGGERCGCGNVGCLETVATDMAFARLASARLGRSLTVDEALDAARAGSLAAEADRVIDNLAVAVAATANLFAPPLIVMHGRLLDAGPGLLAKLTERSAARKLAPYRERCRLVKATTTKAQGALAGIIDHVFDALGPLLPPAGT